MQRLLLPLCLFSLFRNKFRLDLFAIVCQELPIGSILRRSFFLACFIHFLHLNIFPFNFHAFPLDFYNISLSFNAIVLSCQLFVLVRWLFSFFAILLICFILRSNQGSIGSVKSLSSQCFSFLISFQQFNLSLLLDLDILSLDSFFVRLFLPDFFQYLTHAFYINHCKIFVQLNYAILTGSLCSKDIIFLGESLWAFVEYLRKKSLQSLIQLQVWLSQEYLFPTHLLYEQILSNIPFFSHQHIGQVAANLVSANVTNLPYKFVLVSLYGQYSGVNYAAVIFICGELITAEPFKCQQEILWEASYLDVDQPFTLHFALQADVVIQHAADLHLVLDLIEDTPLRELQPDYCEWFHFHFARAVFVICGVLYPHHQRCFQTALKEIRQPERLSAWLADGFVQIVEQPDEQLHWIACLTDLKLFFRAICNGLHQLMGTVAPFELLPAPQLPKEHSEFLQKLILVVLVQEEILTQRRNYIQELQDCIYMVCAAKIIHPDDSWNVLFPVDIELGAKRVDSLQVSMRVPRIEVELHIFHRMGVYLVVVRKTIDASGLQMYKQMVVGLYTVLESRTRLRFALVIAPTCETAVHIVARQSDAAHFVEVEVKALSLDCAQVRAFSRQRRSVLAHFP